jgi:hypothetical protein
LPPILPIHLANKSKPINPKRAAGEALRNVFTNAFLPDIVGNQTPLIFIQ